MGRVGGMLAAAALLALAGCASPDLRNETVATADGEPIRVKELREFLGYRGGGVAASDVPVERKKEALERLTAGRLLAKEARARGLDNTQEFRQALQGGERDLLITALLARELSKVEVSDKEVRKEAGKLREEDKNLAEKEAAARACRAVLDRKARKVEQDLIDAAKKLMPGTIDQGMVERIVRGEKVPDSAVLATVGPDRIDYGSVRRVLDAVPSERHGGQDLSRNPVAIGRVLDREVTGRALAAYASKEGIDKSQWYEATRADFERSVLINLLAERVVFKDIAVTEKEVQAAYAEHGEMFVQQGKKVPLEAIKGQLRAFLENNKRKAAIEAYVEGLKKKAKITIKEELLPKV